jgi:hypothetical protein
VQWIKYGDYSREFIDSQGLKAGCEFMQDATFITTDPGHQK